MKLGLLTACLPQRSLEEIAAWAADTGFQALEVAAWPDLGERPFTATHLRVEDFDERRADEVRGSSLATSSLCPRSLSTTTTCTRTRPSGGLLGRRLLALPGAGAGPG